VNNGIYSTASGSLAAMLRLDAIANNLANANTPGFKSERYVQEASRTANATPLQMPVGTPISRGHLETDFSQGGLTHTGNPLDVAISGAGFFVVNTAHGERLTRHGGFSLDAERYLTTTDGYRVQGEGGDLQLPRGPVEVANDGALRVDGVVAGKLRLVAVPDTRGLRRDTGTLFAAGSQTPADALPGAVYLTQGAIEGANVSPVESLVGLIDTMRGFEAYMHAADRLDQSEARTITDVGRV
jgi:flagellar basal body rod protein FlgG